MFGKKRDEEIKRILESAATDRELYVQQATRDRELYAEQAAHDRALFAEQIASLSKSTLPAVAEEHTPAIVKGQELKAAYALNLCTVSISQIIDYNDLVIMEQEYDAILNNLNLENFPKDEALLKILKQILDVVAFFRIQAEEKKLQEEEYKRRVKDAVWSAIPSPTAILAGGSAGWVGLAAGAVMAVGTGYMNYRRERANIDAEQRRKDWELQRSAMEQFDGLRRELFDTAWRLADTYKFDDKYRLTARQITQYNTILEDSDPQRRYERLLYLKDNFVAYPPFWYYLGHAAAEVSTTKDSRGNLIYADVSEQYRLEAIKAYQVFLNSVDDNVHNNLLREDQTCAACALETFALVAKDEAFPHEEKIQLLQKAAKNAGNAFDTLQMCAASYLAIGETDEAISLLRMLMNEGYNVEMNAQLLSIQYVRSFCSGNVSMRDLHSTLSARVGDQFPLYPMPASIEAVGSGYILASKYTKAQCNHLLADYRDTMCEYIVQCSRAFQKIVAQPRDISADIIGFIQGIETDMQSLFDDQVASRVRSAILADVNALLADSQNRNLLKNQVRKSDNAQFTFDKLFTNAFLLIAEIIENCIRGIQKAEDEHKFRKISEATGQILLFKQKKRIYGTAISRAEVIDESDPYETLRNSSKQNHTAQKCVDVINRFLREDSLFEAGRKKETAHFYTQSDTADISDYLSSNSHVPNDTVVIAILDTKSRDLVFTPTGIIVPRTWRETREVPYGEIKMEKGDIKIGDISFDNSEISNSALHRLIDELALQAPLEFNDDCLKQFREKLENFHLYF